MTWKPPLATEIFLWDRGYWGYAEILEHYPQAKAIAMDIRDNSNESTKDMSFEETLNWYATNDDLAVRLQFMDVPPYLRHLFITVEDRYNPILSYYVQLIRRLRESGHEITFLSLNYDTFIEKAMAIYDDDLVISSMGDYVNATRAVKLVDPAPNLPSLIKLNLFRLWPQLGRAANSLGVSPSRLVCGRVVL